MTDIRYVFSWLLFALLYFLTEGKVGPIINLELRPEQYSERSKVIVSWLPPTELDGNLLRDLRYGVEYCQINTPNTCKNITDLSETSKDITVDYSLRIYTVTVFAIGKDGVKGDGLSKPYIIPAAVTCPSTKYLCSNSNSQCVMLDRRCNSVSDCADGTDETAAAGCLPPITTVTWKNGVALSPTAIQVTWNKVLNQADRLLRYEVKNLNTSIQLFVDHPPNSPATTELKTSFTLLKPGTTYQFQVRSVNPVGPGTWSDVLSVKTLTAAPGPVSNLGITGKQYEERSKALVTWGSPIELNGNLESDLKYTVIYCELNLPATCKNESGITVNEFVFDVVAGKLYEATVSAIDKEDRVGALSKKPYQVPSILTCRNAEFQCQNMQQCLPRLEMKCDGILQCADGSDEMSFANCPAPLAKVTGINVTAMTPLSINVEWIKGTDREFLTSYEVLNIETNTTETKNHPVNQPSVTSVSLVINNLTPNKEYGFQVRAVNRAGKGPWSDTMKATTFSLVSGVTVSLTATQYNELNEVDVSWNVPQQLGQTAASDLKYVVKYCEINKEDTCQTKSNIKDLKATVPVDRLKRLYLITVYAVDKFGVDGVKTSKPYIVPDELTCRNDNFQCANKVQCLPILIMKCDGVYQCVDGSDETAVAGCERPTQNVSWVNGESLSANQIKVTWKKATLLSDRVEKYEIENMNTNVTVLVNHPVNKPSITELSVTIDNLKGNQEYSIRIRSQNAAGYSDWSQTLKVMTQKGSIGPVLDVKNTPLLLSETTGRRIEWKPPTNDNGEDTSKFTYFVTYCELNLPACVNISIPAGVTMVDITGLKTFFPYSFTITPFDSSNKPGQIVSQAFRTLDRNTCQDSTFTCVQSGGCVDKIRLCDGRADCGDGSDETQAGNCNLPLIQPKITLTEPQERSIKITWDKIFIYQGDRISEYIVENMNTSATQQTASFAMEPATVKISVTFDGLYSNQIYQFRVRTKNPSGLGPWSEIATVRTLKAAAPGKVVEVTNEPVLYYETTQRQVKWNSPLDHNGEDPSTFVYLVTYCELNNWQTCMNQTTNNTSFMIKDLKRNLLYLLRISTINAAGNLGGVYQDPFRVPDRDTCQPSFFVCGNPQCVPGFMVCDGYKQCADGSDETLRANCSLPITQVTGLVGIAAANSIDITWNKITLQNDRIEFYEVENMNDNMVESVTHPASQPAVTKISKMFKNLKSNQEYLFRVRGVNPSGAGPWSDTLKLTTDKKTSLGIVGPVTNAKVESILYSESTAVNVTWQPPSDLKNNSANLLTYRVRYCKNNDQCNKFTNLSTNLYVELRALEPITNYRYLIYVYNENGEVGLVFEQDFVTLSVDKCDTTEFTCQSHVACIPRSKLCDGQSDCLDGSDEKSSAGCDFPPVVQNFKFISRTEKSIELQFDTNKDPKHRISKYIVQNQKTNEQKVIPQSQATKLNVVFSNLEIGTLYKFLVFAENLSGKGPDSPALEAYTTGFPTGPVQNVNEYAKLNAETTQRIFDWKPPAMLYDNNLNELKYFVQFCVINTPATCRNSSVSNKASLEVQDLQAGNIYQYKVFAVNTYDFYMTDFDWKIFRTSSTITCGETLFRCESQSQCVQKIMLCDGIPNCADRSDEKKVANCTLPASAPQDVVQDETQTTTTMVTVSFRQNHMSDRVRIYEVKLSNYDMNFTQTQSIEQVFGNAVLRQAKFSNLRAGTTYIVNIRAINDVGEGPYSNDVQIKTNLDKPINSPTSINSQSLASNALKFEFKDLAADGAEKYEVRLTKAGTTMVMVKVMNYTSDGSNNVTLLIRDLEPNTQYNVEIRAINSKGVGPWSAAIGAKTQGVTPIDIKDNSLSKGEIAGIVIAAIIVFIIIVIIIVQVSRSSGKGYISKNGGPDSNGYSNSAYEMDHKY